MKRVLLVVVLVALALPAGSGAVSVGRTSLLYPGDVFALDLQPWVDLSYAPTLDGVVIVHRAPCPGHPTRSCISAPGDEMWLRDEPSRSQLRADLSHELGHRFDYLAMTDSARDAFRRLTRDRRPWRTSPNSPHEQFAEAYSLCFRRRTIPRVGLSIGYDYDPTPKQHLSACKLIRRAAVGAYG